MYLKCYSAIQNLCQTIHRQQYFQDYKERLQDTFMRNYQLIRTYSKQNEENMLSKYKKKIIPKYCQQLDAYAKQLAMKKKKQYYQRRRRKNTRSNRQDQNIKNSSLYDQLFSSQPFIQSMIQSLPAQENMHSLNRYNSSNEVKKVVQNHRKLIDMKNFSIQNRVKLKNEDLSSFDKNKHTSAYFNPIVSKNNFFQASFNQNSSLKRENTKSQSILASYNRNAKSDFPDLQKKIVHILTKKRQMKSHINTLLSFSKDSQKKKKINVKEKALQSKARHDKTVLAQCLSKLRLKGKMQLQEPLQQIFPKKDQQTIDRKEKRKMHISKFYYQEEQVAYKTKNSSKSDRQELGYSTQINYRSKRSFLPKFS